MRLWWEEMGFEEKKKKVRRRSKRGKNGKVWLWWEEMGFRVCF